jgi:hypothetical protein
MAVENGRLVELGKLDELLHLVREKLGDIIRAGCVRLTVVKLGKIAKLVAANMVTVVVACSFDNGIFINFDGV